MSVNSYPFFLCLRTETLAARGDTAAVLETVTGALETARRTGYVEYEAQLVGLRGELLLGVEPSPRPTALPTPRLPSWRRSQSSDGIKSGRSSSGQQPARPGCGGHTGSDNKPTTYSQGRCCLASRVLVVGSHA